jgi:hypothetical protein
MHIADFNADYIASLERNVETGAVNLVAMGKRWL